MKLALWELSQVLVTRNLFNTESMNASQRLLHQEIGVGKVTVDCACACDAANEGPLGHEMS